jgi:hypothetical protein
VTEVKRLEGELVGLLDVELLIKMLVVVGLLILVEGFALVEERGESVVEVELLLEEDELIVVDGVVFAEDLLLDGVELLMTVLSGALEVVEGLGFDEEEGLPLLTGELLFVEELLIGLVVAVPEVDVELITDEELLLFVDELVLDGDVESNVTLVAGGMVLVVTSKTGEVVTLLATFVVLVQVDMPFPMTEVHRPFTGHTVLVPNCAPHRSPQEAVDM